jgi:hypothetical protein
MLASRAISSRVAVATFVGALAPGPTASAQSGYPTYLDVELVLARNPAFYLSTIDVEIDGSIAYVAEASCSYGCIGSPGQGLPLVDVSQPNAPRESDAGA